jgi:hypothetical protein
MVRHIGNQLGKELLMLAQAHRLEKAALPQAFFYKLRPGDEEAGITVPVSEVDTHPIQDGVGIDDITGVRYDGGALREGGDNVRIDQDAVPPDEKECHHTNEDNHDQWPRQAVSMLEHLLNYSKIMDLNEPVVEPLREPLIISNSSLPSRRESSNLKPFWIPAFAGMTFLEVALIIKNEYLPCHGHLKEVAGMVRSLFISVVLRG